MFAKGREEKQENPDRTERFVSSVDCKVASIRLGTGQHAFAAQAWAVFLAETKGVNLTLLDKVTPDVWAGRYDLVLVDREEERGVRDLLLGNVQRQLIRDSPSPVLLVRHVPERRTGRVVVAVDPDPVFLDRTRHAEQTFRTAAAFADFMKFELHVANVALPYRHYVWALTAGFMTEDARRFELEARLSRRQSVRDFLKQVDTHQQVRHVHFLEGAPVQEIASLVDRLSANVLVAGTVGRRGIGGLIIGNTAESLIREVRSSCLIVNTSKALAATGERIFIDHVAAA